MRAFVFPIALKPEIHVNSFRSPRRRTRAARRGASSSVRSWPSASSCSSTSRSDWLLPLPDQDGVVALEVGQHQELVQPRIVAQVARRTGFCSRHCRAVIPNRATLSRFASLA